MQKAADYGGPADPACDGQREGTPEDSVPQRRLRTASSDHPHAALRQAQQDPDAEAGQSLHRLSLPGAPL